MNIKARNAMGEFVTLTITNVTFKQLKHRPIAEVVFTDGIGSFNTIIYGRERVNRQFYFEVEPPGIEYYPTIDHILQGIAGFYERDYREALAEKIKKQAQQKLEVALEERRQKLLYPEDLQKREKGGD